MCGELDDNVQIGQDLLDRFKVMSRMMGLSDPQEKAAVSPTSGPKALASSAGRARYMDQLFNAGLTRALADSAAADPEETIDALASQTIAFARLAGFLAGQLPPEADLFRAAMEAFMAGHAETGRLTAQYRRDQDEAHGHSHEDHEHEHDHSHSHDHHHHGHSH